MACARVRVPGVCAIGSLPVVVALALLVRPFSSPPSEFSPAFFCRVPADSGRITSPAAPSLPSQCSPSLLPGAATFHPLQRHPPPRHGAWGPPPSVDALLTCPRPLLCCCSCSRPFWTVAVQVCVGSAFPPYTPSISLCVRVLCHALGGARAIPACHM